MRDLMKRSTWDQPYQAYTWGSFLWLLIATVVFLAAFGGPAWWVEYYPRPDGLIAIEPRSMGLFRMCIRGDCVVDLTNRLLVAKYVPQEYKEVSLLCLPCSQWLMSFGLFFIIVLYIAYVAFLVGGDTYHLQVILQFVVALLILISVSVYGTYFRGSKPYLPFGWSYWFAVMACFLFLSNAIFMLFVTISVRKKRRMSPMKLYVMKDSDKQHQRLQ